MLSAEFILNTLRVLKQRGMELPEAVSHFETSQLSDALFDGTGVLTPDQRALLDELAKSNQEESNQRELGSAIELWMAGWTHEPQTPNSPIMSWYWRAPAKGNRPKGRRFLSTQQAVNAMRRIRTRSIRA
jgi:hypothetical protein